MKAVYRTKYGSPDVLSVKDVDIPSPSDNEILIKVHAATVNRTDCAILTAEPFIMRFLTGLTKPAHKTTGTDFAGVVQSVGKNVTAFKEGDRVCGFYDNGSQSHAEYMVYPLSKAVMHIPDGVSFEHAAASIEGAHYAFNFFSKVKIEAGQNVLVNGASGAIGSAAVQILKTFDVKITAVCSTKNIDLIRSLGAEKVIDYTKEDFTQTNEKFDFVFDTVGKSSYSLCKPLLKPKGIYISSELGKMSQNPFLALITPLLGGKRVVFPVPVNVGRSMEFILDLLKKGKFNPVIERSYALEEIADAFRYVASGQKTGNVIINIFPQ